MRVFALMLLGISLSPVFAAEDGLAEANARRARKGLRPFVRDAALQIAAERAADYRASELIQGHVRNSQGGDFQFLPSGAQAGATGCAATGDLSWGWLSCCSEENWTYAGAAYAWGQDGRRYMHLFVSNSPNAIPDRIIVKEVATTLEEEPSIRNAGSTEESPRLTWHRMDEGWAYMDGEVQVGFLRNDRMFYWLRGESFSEGQRLEPGAHPKP